MEISLFNVTAVELCGTFLNNSNMRCVRFTTPEGKLEIHCYDNTDALDSLPRSADFREYGASNGAELHREAA